MDEAVELLREIVGVDGSHVQAVSRDSGSADFYVCKFCGSVLKKPDNEPPFYYLLKCVNDQCPRERAKKVLQESARL